ncbi:uncharacterized protein [Blastocystis hominis]|uniref:GOST seven transmembrane domain-containing protein n=1 Tax=Blastocystis hominis TaxID=12968 RepID=D8M151_BLAHO|nr:uncharacterized protein [Blastocystis hominis]CBK21790.2 unnamed protein product [Blastocystis hominis]|eukprot:XP_012895838.1 uncharacterized protein [Blastocystis hominis]
MFDNKTSPASSGSGYVDNYIELEFFVTKNNPSLEAQAVVEVMVVSDDVFQTIGIDEKNEHYYCCDDQAYDNNQCQNHNHLWVRSNETSQYRSSSIDFKGENRTVNVHFDVPKEGKYWIVLGLCDPDTSNVKVSGKAVIMNPYGHIPARMYGIIPFTKWVLLIYTALFLAWIIRCCWYRKELMSVHVMITVVVGTFLFDTVIRLLMLSNFNHEGVYDRKITMFSLFITSATHTVARCLIIMVAMGLGVSKASLGNSMWKIVVMGVVYFFFSLWDSIVSTYSTDSKVNLYRIIPASLLDSFIYFWILQSLLDTIQELEDKKQTGKLDVFISLRNIIIVAVIVSTLYNVLFSYLIMFKKIDSLWKYQWFFNDGVWTSSYLLLVAVIMYLWAPNERSLAYAYHVQVSTDERQDQEEYAMQEDGLQGAGGEGSIQVATVEATEDSLKPMTIKAQSA